MDGDDIPGRERLNLPGVSQKVSLPYMRPKAAIEMLRPNYQASLALPRTFVVGSRQAGHRGSMTDGMNRMDGASPTVAILAAP
jgi:hypothetical protein